MKMKLLENCNGNGHGNDYVYVQQHNGNEHADMKEESHEVKA